MKRILLVPIGALVLSSAFVSAGIIPLTQNYTGQIESFFRRGQDIFTLSGTTTNGYIEEFNVVYPYGGGMGINNPVDMMSPDAIRIATLFYSGKYRLPECWARGYVDGTIRVEPTAAYPSGTPIELQIAYSSEEVGIISPYPLSKGAMLVSPRFEFLWYADHSTGGNIETHSINILSGEQYYFYMWQNVGTEKTPVTTNLVGSAVALNFAVVPEPGSLFLLALGAIVMRRRRTG